MALSGGLRSGLVACCLLSAAAPALADDSPKPGPDAKPECVVVTTQASFASVGYDHIVRLKNTCKASVSCSVKTDVNPEPASVELEPGESTSVVTWRGSPAREFKADVSCSTTGGARR